MTEQEGVVSSLWDDMFWPFRKYAKVNDFVSRTEAAGLVLTGTGFLLSAIGFSPAISGAVGAVGLSSTLTEIFLRIYFNKEDPLDGLNVVDRGLGVLVNVLVGFGIYIYQVSLEAALNAPSIILTQYVAGLIIAFFAGFVYMRTYSIVSYDANQATKIIIPSFTSFGFLVAILWGIPVILEGLDIQFILYEMLQVEPEYLEGNVTAEQALNKTNSTVVG